MAVKASAPVAITTSASKKAAPTFEEIAQRSYERYLARGGVSGHDVEDWLAAEAELRA